jgi:glutamate-5-semialdehyde dehydrogenase
VAARNQALRALARLLRANIEPLQAANARDLARAGELSAPMRDRLKLTPPIVETCAQGCEQLAAMPDLIGEIVASGSSPAASAWGRCACPSACSA